MPLPLLLPLLLITTATLSALSQAAPNTILFNAKVYANQPASAVAIEDGLISYIGDDRSALALGTDHTELIDLEGAMLLPGFIDNHNHLFEAASPAGGACMLSDEEDLTGLIPYLQDCARHAVANEWLIGHGFNLDALLHSDHPQSPRRILDTLFPEQPVVLMEQTSHAVWVNSAALQRMQWHRHTPQPEGGWLLKDHSGALSGVLLDSAGDRVMERAWGEQRDLARQNLRGLRHGLAEVARAGITTVGDGRLYWRRGWFSTWQRVAAAGELTARVSLRPWIYPELSIADQLPHLQKMWRNDLRQLLVVNQVKLYSDGIITNSSAKLLDDYRYSYIPERPRGLNYIAPQALGQWLEKLQAIGYGAHIHAIGDGAVRESLDAIAALPNRNRSTQYSLTHVEMLDPADTSRFIELNITADFQVGAPYISSDDHSWAQPFIGRARLDRLQPLGRIFRTGANVTLSSDWDVNPLSPLAGIANSLVLGRHGLPDIHSAIAAYTINAARSLGLAQVTGSITRGKSADFTVLDRDITQLNPAQIRQTQVLMTWLQGKVVYDIEAP